MRDDHNMTRFALIFILIATALIAWKQTKPVECIETSSIPNAAYGTCGAGGTR